METCVTNLLLGVGTSTSTAVMAYQLTYIQILVMTACAGAFGGLVAACMNRINTLFAFVYSEKVDAQDNESESSSPDTCEECTLKQKLNGSTGFGFLYFICMILIGVGGSLGTLLLYAWLGQLKTENNTLNVITIVCLGVVSGVISNKFLPKIGDQVEAKFLAQQANNKAISASKRVQVAESMIRKSQQYTEAYVGAMAAAETALGRNSSIDVTYAISRLQDILPAHRLNRTVNIYLGRLHRKNEDFVHAILCLRDYIRAIRESNDCAKYNKDAADAYYNIACYHSLMVPKATSDSERERLTKEAIVALIESRDLCQSSIQDAAEDKDFDAIKNNPDFKKVLLGELGIGSH